MKTILVDARNTFITAEWVDQNLKTFLDSLENPKIILTNANEDEKIKLGIVNMPYEVFSLSHDPDKINPIYYKKMLENIDWKQMRSSTSNTIQMLSKVQNLYE